MSDLLQPGNVIAVICGLVLIVALILYKDRLMRLVFRIGLDGAQTEMNMEKDRQTEDASSSHTSARGNLIEGNRSSIRVSGGGASAESNRLIGNENELDVSSDKPLAKDH